MVNIMYIYKRVWGWVHKDTPNFDVTLYDMKTMESGTNYTPVIVSLLHSWSAYHALLFSERSYFYNLPDWHHSCVCGTSIPF